MADNERQQRIVVFPAEWRTTTTTGFFNTLLLLSFILCCCCPYSESMDDTFCRPSDLKLKPRQFTVVAYHIDHTSSSLNQEGDQMPLNPSLYARVEALVRRKPELGPIAIANPDQRGTARVVRLPGGKKDFNIGDFGESYRVNCPFCGERHRKLYVNYRYGQPNPASDRHYPMKHLFKCFNSNCQGDRNNRKQLWDLLFGSSNLQRPHGVINRSTATAPMIVDHSARVSVELPEHSTLIDQLPDDHPATTYLRNRDFDPAELSQVWGVRYVLLWSQSRASNRILIPVERPQLLFVAEAAANDYVLAGWQARYIGEPDDATPKYLFADNFSKSKVLYGLWQAKQTTGPVLVVEGVTDVWRAGPGAVATFGKSVSRDQLLLLRFHFAGRPIVILPDADARETAGQHARQLQSMRPMDSGDCRVVVAALPSGRLDPGECTREEIWGSAATALGIIAAQARPTAEEPSV